MFQTSARGILLGSRGGRFHRDNYSLRPQHWSSKQWIWCKIEFNNRHRDVWGDSYSELFFLDEVTALAAGHRPCFECRRKDAEAFATLFSGKDKRASAATMDEVLHAERLTGKAKRLHRRAIDRLPDGAMIAIGDDAFAVRGEHLLCWTAAGYVDPQPLPRVIDVDVLTPPSILAVLGKGYRPRWHPSAA